ncbi:MAG: RNB domain-containing ribonuclease [Actinomycetales bacterium]
MRRTYVRPGAVATPEELTAAFEAVLADVDAVEEFPAAAQAEAVRAAETPHGEGVDLTDLNFVTLDPAGAMDLDQAMCLQRTGTGFTVRYAIADVPAFVTPGGPLDVATRERGQTLYLPHRRVPLHPAVLSEGAASLLPGQLRPALVWTIEVDETGVTTSTRLERAQVRSRARYDYAAVQASFDAGTPPDDLALLEPLGKLLVAAEAERGGAGLKIPNQEIEPLPGGGYALIYRPLVGVEEWNAQISLLTGRAAADLMLAGGIGILRTMPEPDQATVDTLRRQSAALGVPWPTEEPYQHWLRTLDPTKPRELALCHEAAALFRGAGYTAFHGEPPEEARQAAVADEYAHVTAPLRRLVDRFGLATCLALSAGEPVPPWVVDALPALPDLMRASDQKASRIEHACLDLAEAAVLATRVGDYFDGVIVDVRGGSTPPEPLRGKVQLHDPAVLAPVTGPLVLGDQVSVRLDEADLASRTIRFSVA